MASKPKSKGPNLFAAAGLDRTAPRPLADKLRPEKLSEVVGQDHLLGPDGTLVTAESLRSAVAVLLHRPWDEAEAHAKAAGALIGAYPVG